MPELGDTALGEAMLSLVNHPRGGETVPAERAASREEGKVFSASPACTRRVHFFFFFLAVVCLSRSGASHSFKLMNILFYTFPQCKTD